MRRSMLLLTCFFALAGCTEQVAACPNPGDLRYEDGRCAPPNRPDSGTPPADAQVDSGDAATCDCSPGEMCLADGSCGQCEVSADCTDQVCDMDTHLCVECVASTDCGADRPTCEMNECVASCDRDLCSANFAGVAPACDTPTGRCVACTPDEFEGTDCMGNSCDPTSRTCTTTPLGSLELCAPCVRSSECASHTFGTVSASMACVETFFGVDAASVGSYCLVDATPAEVLDCPRGTPFALDRAPVDDSTMRSYCTPTTASTCPAVFDTSTCPGADASGCGVAGVDDSTCNMDRCRSHCEISEPFTCGIAGETCIDRGTAADFCRR